MTTSCPWIGTGYFNPPGAAGGGTNGIIAQRYSITELKAVDPSAIASGTMTFVATVRDSYYYDASSTLNADGITVIAPDTGSGRWIRMNLGNETWRRQATWFIDPSPAGDDEADGSTAETALSTHAELRRRWGPGRALLQPPGDTVEVTILGDLPQEDPIELDVEVRGDVLVRYKGTVTPTTLTVSDAWDASTVSEDQYTAGLASGLGFDLSPYVGQRLRIVTPSGDAYAWILATYPPLGEIPQRADISAPALVDFDAVPFDPTPAIVGISGSDTFIAEDLTKAYLGPVSGVRVVTGYPLHPAIVFEDLRLGGEAITSADLATTVTEVDFVGCHLEDIFLFNALSDLTVCRLSTCVLAKGIIVLHACAAMPGTEGGGANLSQVDITLDAQNVWYGIQFSMESSSVRMGTHDLTSEPALSVFYVPDDGIRVDSTSAVRVSFLVWGDLGSGSKYGWNVSPGGRVYYDPGGPLPIITGASGDTVIGGVDRNYSTSPDLPFFNVDNGAAFVEEG